jgi:hypothetical protein
MRKTILLGLVALTGVALMPAAASAQYYNPYYRPGYRPPPPFGYPPPYGYRPAPPHYYGGGYGGGYYRPHQLSSVCITSRGNCSTGRPLPGGAPCQCFIPGFGTKRGAVPTY